MPYFQKLLYWQPGLNITGVSFNKENCLSDLYRKNLFIFMPFKRFKIIQLSRLSSFHLSYVEKNKKNCKLLLFKAEAPYSVSQKSGQMLLCLAELSRLTSNRIVWSNVVPFVNFFRRCYKILLKNLFKISVLPFQVLYLGSQSSFLCCSGSFGCS